VGLHLHLNFSSFVLQIPPLIFGKLEDVKNVELNVVSALRGMLINMNFTRPENPTYSEFDFNFK